MAKFILLITCLLAGVVLRKTKYFDAKSPVIINQLLIYFFIPVLTLYHVPKITFEIEQVWLSITPFVVYIMSFLFFKAYAKIYTIDQKTEGALIMCSGIGSISFVGFPIFELLYGQEGLAYGLILSLAGTFLVFNTLGISTGLYYANSASSSFTFFIRKICTFPPFVAFVIASIFNFSDWIYPVIVDIVLKQLAAPFAVLALIAIGMQLDFSFDRSLLRDFLFGQFYKLFIAPLLIYFLMWHLLGVDDLVGRICVLGSAIGSMNAISIVAAQMGLNPKLSSLMPAIGIPMSIPLLFLIHFVLSL